MPLAPMPVTMEFTDFSAGVVPKAEEVGIPPNALTAATNLMLDQVTGAVIARAGTRRLAEATPAVATDLDGYRLYSMHHYTPGNGNHYIICVFSSDILAVENNVMLYALVLADPQALHGTDFFRIDTADREWNTANGRHWGTTIDGIYYGGGEDDKMYSWDPTRVTPWDADPGTPDYPTWRELGSGSLSDNRNRDYAFKLQSEVTYTYTKDAVEYTESFRAKKDIRYDKWDGAVGRYRKGDRVSTSYAVNAEGAYWRSWEAVEGHTPSEANMPGSGAGMWKKVRLMRPVDDDMNLNAEHWDRIPDAPMTHIATWHGNRLLARNDKGTGGKQTLIYSRVAKVADKDNIGKDVIGKPGDPQWDPDDWRGGGAEGAGFQPFETKEGDDIEAICSFGYYAIIFKRYSTHVIAGTNPDTWTVRQLSDVGTIHSHSVCEHEGWIYFISDRGFYRTDGTQVTVVPGHEKIAAWLRESIDWSQDLRDIELQCYDDCIWMTLPTNNAKDNNLILIYEPHSKSFWPQDLHVQTMVVARRNGRDRLFMATVNESGTADVVYDWTGAPNESTSTRTEGATITTNYFTNPNFSKANQWDAPDDWTPFTPAQTKLRVTKAAARRGVYGVEIQNLREKDSEAGPWEDGYEGMYDTITLPAGDYVIQVAARRRSWASTNPRKVPDLRFVTNGDPWLPTGSVYLGDGWHKMFFYFTAEAGAQQYGVLVGANTNIQVDEAIITEEGGTPDVAVLYFDGKGGELEGDSAIVGTTRPYILQYDHEDAVDADNNATDDTQEDTYAGEPIPWYARTAWFTFGALQEERRIRRLWALVRGSGGDAGIRTFRNFGDIDAGSNIEPMAAGVIYNEGVLPEDCHSIQVEVEGTDSPAALLGIALDTEPRRIRFGRR